MGLTSSLLIIWSKEKKSLSINNLDENLVLNKPERIAQFCFVIIFFFFIFILGGVGINETGEEDRFKCWVMSHFWKIPKEKRKIV